MKETDGMYVELTPAQYEAMVAFARTNGLPIEYGTHRDKKPNLHAIPRGSWPAAKLTAFKAALTNAK